MHARIPAFKNKCCLKTDDFVVTNKQDFIEFFISFVHEREQSFVMQPSTQVVQMKITDAYNIQLELQPQNNYIRNTIFEMLKRRTTTQQQ